MNTDSAESTVLLAKHIVGERGRELHSALFIQAGLLQLSNIQVETNCIVHQSIDT